MARRGARDVMVGTFVTLALLVLSIAVMTVGGESRLGRGVVFRAVFSNTEGLRVGSPVKMAGVQVGSVREVRLPTDPGSPGIEVDLSVGKTYAARVRTDTRASLGYLQVLSGEKYVQLTPGSLSAKELEAGDEIPSDEQPALLQQGADIAGNINEITVSLKNILGPLERGEGLVGQALKDPNFGKEGLGHLKESLENLEQITARLRDGRGFAGRILFDEEFAGRVDDISRSLKSLATALDEIGRREGALGALTREGGAGQKAIEDIRDAAASLRRATLHLESSEGLFGRLLNDREYSEGVAQDIRRALRNVAEITEKINRGEGTLGALVNERVLHDGLEEVVAGVNDSKFARWLMRHYQKKGIETMDTPSDSLSDDESEERKAP